MIKIIGKYNNGKIEVDDDSLLTNSEKVFLNSKYNFSDSLKLSKDYQNTTNLSKIVEVMRNDNERIF